MSDERHRINRMGLWLLFFGAATAALVRYLGGHHPTGFWGSVLGVSTLACIGVDILIVNSLQSAIKSYRATRRYRPWR